MHLRRLAVTDFRSWEAAELDLAPGITVLVGPNGVGKTNLVEAAGYLATLGSHRVATDAPLIRRGAERAVVRGQVVHLGRELSVELEITAGRANRARVNRAPGRARDVLGILRTVLFAPEDLALVRAIPASAVASSTTCSSPATPATPASAPTTTGCCASARPCSRPRGSGGGDLRTLDVWDGNLAAHGAALLAGRLELVAAIAPPAVEAFAEVAPTSPPIG